MEKDKMKNKVITDRLSMILTKGELERISIGEIKGQTRIRIDLHEMRCAEAKRTINNIIAINREPCVLDLIHGYNHGTALKEMIQTDLDSYRIVSINSNPYNPGETFLNVA